jgi:hypothetical protein
MHAWPVRRSRSPFSPVGRFDGFLTGGAGVVGGWWGGGGVGRADGRIGWVVGLDGWMVDGWMVDGWVDGRWMEDGRWMG